MPYSFQDVQTAWEQARSSDSFFRHMSIGEFSRFMNEHTGTADYAAGDVGAFGAAVKNVSTGIDMSLQPASQAMGDVGAGLGALIGPKAEVIGRETGESLPRVGAGAALTLGGLALAPFSAGTSTAGTAAGLVMLGLGTADTIAKTYTDTGSPVAGLIQGGVNIALPAVGKVGASVAGKVTAPLTAKVAGATRSDALAALTQAGSEYAGSQIAALGAQEVGSQAVSKVATGKFYNPLDPEHLGRVLAGNLPFAALDIANFYRTAKSYQPVIRDVTNLQGQMRKSAQEIDELAQGAQAAPVVAAPPVEVIQTPQGPREQLLIPEVAATTTPNHPRLKQKPPMFPQVENMLRNMEEDGATPEQMVRAVEESAKAVPTTQSRFGETPEELAFREAGFAKAARTPAAPDELLRSTDTYFRRLYQQRGETPERVDFLTRNALKVAARFQGIDDVTVFRVLDSYGGRDANFAMRPIGEFERKFVGLLGNQGFDSMKRAHGDLGMENFAQLFVLGHELAHQHQFRAMETNAGVEASLGYGGQELRHYQQAFYHAAQMTTQQKQDTISATLQTMIPGKYESGKNILQGRRISTYDDPKTGTTEFLADLTGLLSMASADSKTAKYMGDALKFSDAETVNFAKGLYRDLTSVFGAVRGLFTKRNMKVEGNALQVIHDNLRSMLRSVEKAEQIVDSFLATSQRGISRAFEAPAPLTYDEAIAQYHRALGDSINNGAEPAWVRDAAELMVPIDKPRELGGQRLSWWDNLKPIAQLVEKFPILRPAFHLGRAYRTLVSSNTLNLWSAFANEKGKFDKTLVQELGKEGSQLNKVFNKIALQQQVEKRTLWDPTVLKSKFPEFAALKESDQQKVIAGLTKFGQVASSAAVQRIRAHREDVEGAASRILQAHDRQMTADEAIALGKKVVKAAWDGKPDLQGRITDDVGSTVAASELASAGTSDAGVAAALAAASDNYDTHLTLQKRLLGDDGRGKLWYFPEVRLGEWMLAWKEKGGKEQLHGYKNKAEAEQKFRELQAMESAGKLEYLYHENKTDKNDRYRGLNRDMYDVYRQADQRLYDSVLNKIAAVGDPDTINKIRKEFQPGAGAVRMETSDYMLPRQHVGGREKINMVEGMIHYIDATSHGLAKRWVKTRQATILNDPELRANPNLQNTARDYLKNVTNPPAGEFTTLKNLVFWNYMGLNPSSLPIEATQQVLTLVPYLVDKGSGVGDAYKHLGQAQKDVVNANVFGKGYSDKDLERYVKEAKNNRTIDTGIVQDLYATEDVDFVNTRNLLTGKGQFSEVKDIISKPGYHLLKAARDFYGIATKFNSETAFVASYQFARSKLKLSPEAANKFAIDATDTTMFGGGTANRPMVLYGLGKAQGVGGLMYSLQGYTFNMLSMMAHLTKKSIAGSRLSPAEKLSARKAAGLMIGTQAVLGGVMGLPLVAAVTAVVDQIFPEAQVKKNLREAFFNLAGDDENLGHIIADGSMNGLFNAVTPADVGSRFQLGNMLGVNAYDGFSWKNLVGPAGAMLENYVKAGQDAVHGKTADVIEKASPSGLRGLVRMVQDSGAIKDRQGNLMFEATPAEQTLLALGFKPKRYNQSLERKALMAQAEKVAQVEGQEFHNQVADALQAGDSATVQQLLYSRQMQQPGYDVQAGIKRVVEIVQNRVTPVDPRRQGSLANAQQVGSIARLYPRGAAPTEVEKLQSQIPLLQASGIPVRPPSGNDFQRAALIDQIMQQNPSLQRSQAAAIVDQMMGGGASSYRKFGSQGPVPQWQGF